MKKMSVALLILGLVSTPVLAQSKLDKAIKKAYAETIRPKLRFSGRRIGLAVSVAEFRKAFNAMDGDVQALAEMTGS